MRQSSCRTSARSSVAVATGVFAVHFLLAVAAGGQGSGGSAVKSVPKIYAFALDGRVREAKSECGTGGCSSYVLLRSEAAAAKDEGLGDERNLELWRLDTPDGSNAQPSMRRLRSRVPDNAGRLALCERQEERSLIMLQALGSVFFVDPDGADQVLQSGTRVGSQKWSAPAAPWRSDCSELMLVGPGAVRQVKLAGRGTRRSVLEAIEFPIGFSIRRNGSGLTLESPPVRAVDGQTPQAQSLSTKSGMVAVGPLTYDDLRLESLVFEPSDGSAQWLESLQDGAVEGSADADGRLESGMLRSWSRLPAAEEVLQSRYTRVNGELVLVTVTKEADKVGLLERKKVRLFELEADRSRSGKAPFFEVLSASRLWQRLDIRFVDLTGDDLDDLVLIQPEGLSGEPTLADVFVATSARRFSKKKRTVLKTGAAWWSMANDWSGDGRPDVAVLDGDVLQFHYGTDPAQAEGKRKRRASFWSPDPTLVLRLSDSVLVSSSDEALGGREQAVEQAVRQMGASVLQRVWVGDRIMVIPAVFERESSLSVDQDDAVVSAGYEDEDGPEPSEDEAEDGKQEQSVVYIVRPGQAP